MSTRSLEEILALRAAQLAALAEEPEDEEQGETMLLLELGKTRVATSMEPVLEVLPLDRPFPVPLAPPALLGLMNHRGAVIPCVDLGTLIGLPSLFYDRSAGLLCGEPADRLLLVVGKVKGLITPSSEDRRGIPRGLPEGIAPFVRETLTDGTMLLDTKAILADSRLHFQPRRGSLG